MNCPSCNHSNEEGAKFCGGCGGDLEAFASEYDRPEAIVQYRELLTDFLGDLELEDWEEEELERTRGELKVTVAAHDALVEEMGGTADTPIPIAILLDTSQIEKFHVGGSCVFSFQFENQSERAVRSISLTFKDSELPESKTVKTKPIGPGRSSQEQKVEVLGQSGAHELTGDVTVVKTSGDPEQFELEPVTYDVGRDSDTPTQITMDMSSLRVADLSGVQMGATGAESGVVSDRTWYPLKLIRVSTAIRAEQIAEEQQKQKAVEEAEEERKRQETEAIEKARLDVDEAEKEKKRQELAQKQEEREAERREYALDAELEIKLKQDLQDADIGTKVLVVLQGFEGTGGLYVGGSIPEKKANNALKSFGSPSGHPSIKDNVNSGSEVLHGLIDGTAFGSAKEGVIFGSKTGIYFADRSSLVKRGGFIPYEKLAGIPEEDIILEPVIDDLEQTGCVSVGHYLIRSGMGGFNASTLKDILTRIRQIFSS